MSRNTPLPLTHPRTVRNLTHCANCKQHGPERQPICLASGDPVIACAKHDFCEHPAGPRFGTDRRPKGWPSRGLGDTVAKVLEMLHITGPGKAARTYIREAQGKKGCGCGETRKKLNVAAPYSTPAVEGV